MNFVNSKCKRYNITQSTVYNSMWWGGHIQQAISKIEYVSLYLITNQIVSLTLTLWTLCCNAYILPHFKSCCVILGKAQIKIDEKLVKLQ